MALRLACLLPLLFVLLAASSSSSSFVSANTQYVVERKDVLHSDLLQQQQHNEVHHISQSQYCAACHVVVEEFLRYTLKNLQSGKLRVELSRSNLIPLTCDDSVIGTQFKPFFRYGCHKLLSEHWETVLSPFIGEHNVGAFNSLVKMYNHKEKSCRDVGACPAHFTIPTVNNDDNECHACRQVVADLEISLLRYDYRELPWPYNATRSASSSPAAAASSSSHSSIAAARHHSASIIDHTLRDVCHAMPIHHSPYEQLETVCFDMAEDDAVLRRTIVERVMTVLDEQQQQQSTAGGVANEAADVALPSRPATPALVVAVCEETTKQCKSSSQTKSKSKSKPKSKTEL